MKYKAFFIVTLLILAIVIVVCFTIYNNSLEHDCVEPEPEPITLDVNIPLNYSKLPEVENLPFEQYPEDLTPIMESLQKLDPDFYETEYYLTVDNYSYQDDETQITGSIKLTYFDRETNLAKFYGANIQNNVLKDVYYTP